MKIKSFTILYIILILARIFLGVIVPEFNLLFGGALVGSLLAYYILQVSHQNQFYILSLICAMIADIILAFGKVPSVGLSYIFYGLFFALFAFVLKRAFKKPGGTSLALGIIIIVLSAIISVVYVQALHPDWRFFPYIIPSTIVAFMGVNLKSNLKNPITIGVILLFVSTILLTLGSQKELPFFIPYLLCYASGQYLICTGLVDSYKRGLEKLAKQKV